MSTSNAQGQWPLGFRVNPRPPGPSPEWIERYRDIPTSWVSDSMGRCIGTVGLDYYYRNKLELMVCGPALTVRVRPGDNLMIHKALEMAQPGDVIVIDGGGDLAQALLGGNMQLIAIHKGVAAIVVDGAIRDVVDWVDGRLPCWAKGHTHRGPSKDGPGEVNVPIVCAGLAVSPGDLILGDADGILAVPPSQLEAIWPAVERQKKKEATNRIINPAGKADPEAHNSILRAKGCPV